MRQSKKIRCEVYEGPDAQGRYSYALFWMTNYHPGQPDGEHGWKERGQHFYGKLPQNIKFVDKRPESQQVRMLDDQKYMEACERGKLDV